MNPYPLLKPWIYKFTPEQAHHGTIAMLRLGGGLLPGRLFLNLCFHARQSGPAVQAFGLTFPNPIGMAAGYDKDGLGWRGLACLGFGHIELGTVTPRPQPGNPQPRIFRLVEDEAVINRMGFPNQGAEFMVRRLKAPRPKGLILGMNIGKNKVTPLEQAAEDYVTLARVFAPLADYLAVNVSSPNTPGLRNLQSRQALEALLLPLAEERRRQAELLGRPVPVVVKLAPDLSDAELDGALEAVSSAGMDGLIISNTTISRPALRSSMANEVGGLSGVPLRELNTAMIKKVVTRTGGRLPVIASGGVHTPADAQSKLDAGATLVQLYTGMIYAGPWLVRDILNSGLICRK
ncbi:MAG: quinone-dependent dihydroorotate dehydrogenase [Anaerolineaceae bacterium]|nr:quinone-dependent dihydroorotate dehydrogenase [Anaerolineaceae bacterium]